MRKPSAISLATALAFATMITLSACGGTGSTPVPSTPSGSSFNGPGPAGNAVITVGSGSMSETASTPTMPNVLSAQVTIGSITAANADGTTTTIMSNPATVELAHLGTSATLLDVDTLPQGTYNSITFTLTGADVTYLNAGVVTTASTTPASKGATPTLTIANSTLTETFDSPIVVNWQNASDLNIEFDLPRALSVSSGVVTFAPATTADAKTNAPATASVTLAQVSSLPAPALLHVDGTVASKDASNSSLVLTTESGYNETVFTDPTVDLTSLTAGQAIRTDATLNADGSLTALTVETADDGTAEIPDKDGNVIGGVVGGVVTGTTGSGSSMTAFTMVVTSSSNALSVADADGKTTDTVDLVGKQITVDLNPGSTTTTFTAAAGAVNAGQDATLAFDASQIFPGQNVWVAGLTDATSVQSTTATTVILDASNVVQSAVGLQGTLGTVTATVGSDSKTDTAYVFPLTTTFSGLPDGSSVTATAVTCNTVGSGPAPTNCTAANLEGPYLNPIDVAKNPPPAGNTVGARGYLTTTGTTSNLAVITIYDAAALPKS